MSLRSAMRALWFPAIGAALLLAGLDFCAAGPRGGAEPGRSSNPADRPSRLVGGCQTVGEAYGLAAFSDSAAVEAVRRALSPAPAEAHGATGEQPPSGRTSADSEAARIVPLFVQIGAVDSPDKRDAKSLAQQLSDRLGTGGLTLASRTLLLHTSGPCFPPYHIDFQAWGDSLAVGAFLDSLPHVPWEGFAPAKERSQRDVFVSAGTSLQAMDDFVDLKREKR